MANRMAVAATHLALRYFQLYTLETPDGVKHSRNVEDFVVKMVKNQDAKVRIAAINARVGQFIFTHPTFICRPNQIVSSIDTVLISWIRGFVVLILAGFTISSTPVLFVGVESEVGLIFIQFTFTALFQMGLA